MPSPTLTLDPRLELTMARKTRGLTHWVEGEYPIDARPDALFAAFEEAGWTLNPTTESIPAFEPLDIDHTLPPGQRARRRGYRVKEFSLTKPGTGLFGGWTEDEKRANLREARALLRRFGFARIPVWTKTWRDLV